jgi:hypothetical protein
VDLVDPDGVAGLVGDGLVTVACPRAATVTGFNVLDGGLAKTMWQVRVSPISWPARCTTVFVLKGDAPSIHLGRRWHS